MQGRPPHIRDEDILDAARDVFQKEGFATTTAEIARWAGVSEGSVFNRFKSKEALFAALIDRETRPSDLIREIVKKAGTGSLAGNLASVVAAVVESVNRAHPFFELLEVSPISFRVHAALRSQSSPPPVEMVAMIAAYLQAEQDLGRVRPMDHTTTGRALIGACVERVRSRRFVENDLNEDAFIRSLVDLLLAGVSTSRVP
jgi:AcrR family transcriptional regulator